MVNKTLLVNLLFSTFFLLNQVRSQNTSDFVKVDGTQFVGKGSRLYFNGFNAYWLMLVASNTTDRAKVSNAMQESMKNGLNLGRTWAFSDGGQWPLQSSPGSYNEAMFQGLDFVISEAKKNGIYLILSLVNNYDDFGGKKQYVQWARERGQIVASIDDFYRNDVVKGYYKNHVKTILTRVNTITGVAYKDEATILSWELINEPRCESDLSGKTFQAWIQEMAAYVKSIDSAHLLEVGLEGFYGEASQQRKQFNPNGYIFGTDYIPNNQVQDIDFATIHAYPSIWLQGSSDQTQFNFLKNWTEAHVEDTAAILKKPVVFTEFGKSLRDNGSGVALRDAFLTASFDSIYNSSLKKGPLVGGLFWQLLDDGLDKLKDGFEIILSSDSSTAKIISDQSLRLAKLKRPILK